MVDNIVDSTRLCPPTELPEKHFEGFISEKEEEKEEEPIAGTQEDNGEMTSNMQRMLTLRETQRRKKNIKEKWQTNE